MDYARRDMPWLDPQDLYGVEEGLHHNRQQIIGINLDAIVYATILITIIGSDCESMIHHDDQS